MTLLVSKIKQHECIHHWMINYPYGPTSYGRCKFCGKITKFSNSLENHHGLIKRLPDNSPIQQIN